MRGFKGLNFSLMIGALFTVAVLTVTLMEATTNPWIYLNVAGFVIVFGGLVTATLVIIPFREMWSIFKKSFALVKRNPRERVDIVWHMVQMAQTQATDGYLPVKGLEKQSNVFFREAVELLGIGLRSDDLKKLFELKMETNEGKAASQTGFYLTLAKLGPGLGLVGTLVGMVSLLYQMGQGLGMDAVGPSMAVALCATFYGVATSNLIFIPLAEALNYAAEQDQMTARLVVEGVVMLKDKRHPVHVREALKAYLSPLESKLLTDALAPANVAKMKESNVA